MQFYVQLDKNNKITDASSSAKDGYQVVEVPDKYKDVFVLNFDQFVFQNGSPVPVSFPRDRMDFENKLMQHQLKGIDEDSKVHELDIGNLQDLGAFALKTLSNAQAICKQTEAKNQQLANMMAFSLKQQATKEVVK